MTVLQIVLGALPVLLLLVLLGGFRLPAHWSGLAVLAATAAIALLGFGMPADQLALAAAEGGAMALWPIMLVIIAAIFTYNLAVQSGSMGTIKAMLVAISPDRRIQVLILAWGFGGFLEAVAGYGTAVAIPASILAALGFNPVFAAVISLIANTVPTAFGAVGIPVSTLAQITGLSVGPLATAIGLQLTPFIILVPLALVMLTGRSDPVTGKILKGWAGLKGIWGLTLAAGLAFALPQLAAAVFLGAELPAVLGSLSSMAVTILLARRRTGQAAAASQLLAGSGPSGGQPGHVDATVAGPAVALPDSPLPGFKAGFLAWLPYLLILGFILLTSPLFPAINHGLGALRSTVVFHPGWPAQTFKWLATPGVLIILAALIGGRLQGLRLGAMLATLGRTVWQLKTSALTVVTILALAKIMTYSGMIQALAGFLTSVTGPVYPLFASFLGTLGTFMTGSDTSSNVLFGSLQTEVAARTGTDPYWLAAANTAGATAGKMISPQSIAVATSATGLQGKEGEILSRTILFCLGYVLLLGLLVFGLASSVRFG